MSISLLQKSVDVLSSEVSNELNLNHINVLLYVASHPNVSAVDMGAALGMLSGSLSKILRTLGQYIVKDDNGNNILKGYDLIEVKQDLYERRRLAITLTRKGENLIKALGGI